MQSLTRKTLISSCRSKSKSRSHSKKREGNGTGERGRSSPAIMEVDEPQEAGNGSVHSSVTSPTKKSKQPIKFYIDDDDAEEKENLIKGPTITVDPPSDHSRLGSPDVDDTHV